MGGSPSIGSLFAQRVIIGVGEMAASNNVQVVLSTYALGSCVGVIAYDPIVKAAGILHLMLPESSISPDKVQKQPAMFADTGLPAFMRTIMGLRGEKSRLCIFVAGGASVLGGNDPFRIGERNLTATLKYFAKEGISVDSFATGGSINRTLHFEVNTGTVTLKTPSENTRFVLSQSARAALVAPSLAR
ncbi:MAG: chemotaxis protein CheD [Candidatus Didemnitutus sp.]|nr:chemotaxis protein CheD [Candidatus Didemnitutus sp.]